jgi:hypothetical protein
MTGILIREGTYYHTLEHLIERFGKEKLKHGLLNSEYVIGIDVNIKEKLFKKGFATSAISSAVQNMKRGKSMNHLQIKTGRVKPEYYGKNIYSTIDTAAVIIDKAEEKKWTNNKVKQHEPYPNMVLARGAKFLVELYTMKPIVSLEKKNN